MQTFWEVQFGYGLTNVDTPDGFLMTIKRNVTVQLVILQTCVTK